MRCWWCPEQWRPSAGEDAPPATLPTPGAGAAESGPGWLGGGRDVGQQGDWDEQGKLVLLQPGTRWEVQCQGHRSHCREPGVLHSSQPVHRTRPRAPAHHVGPIFPVRVTPGTSR